MICKVIHPENTNHGFHYICRFNDGHQRCGACFCGECAENRISALTEAARSVRKDVIVLCHGGPIAMPSDAQYILNRCDIHGFYGASSMERLPTESAIKQQVADFMKLTMPG